MMGNGHYSTMGSGLSFLMKGQFTRSQFLKEISFLRIAVMTWCHCLQTGSLQSKKSKITDSFDEEQHRLCLES